MDLTSAAEGRAPAAVAEVLESPGAPLDAEARRFLEPLLGHDFGSVRVHTGERASSSAREIDAAAYTSGEHVVADRRHLDPKTVDGVRLLSHELTHVVQQRAASTPVVQRQDLRDFQSRSECRRNQCHDYANDLGDPPPLLPWPDLSPASALPPTDHFFHGTTWAVAQSIPGNVQPLGGGDFGRGFYTHHDADDQTALNRAKWEGCRLCTKLGPQERYAGVINFDVPLLDYWMLPNQRHFDLTSTDQPDYAERQEEWLDFVSGPGRGRRQDPEFNATHMAWRHERVDPPPDQGYDILEGPFYRGVQGLPGPGEPERSEFRPFEEGTALPQQVVWNGDRAMSVLNRAPTTLKQFDSDDNCREVDPPVAVAPAAASTPEDARIADEIQREMTGV